MPKSNTGNDGDKAKITFKLEGDGYLADASGHVAHSPGLTTRDCVNTLRTCSSWPSVYRVRVRALISQVLTQQGYAYAWIFRHADKTNNGDFLAKNFFSKDSLFTISTITTNKF